MTIIMMYMVILVMYDHFHGIKSLFCHMEHKFPAVNKKCPQNLLSKPVPLYMTLSKSLMKGKTLEPSTFRTPTTT